jgi:ABC transport system ATP-binding/permease protein
MCDLDGFMKISAALDAARSRLAICEDRWLELAEQSEALG